MSFALIIIGSVLLIASIRGTQGSLFTLVQGDFTGPNNFIFWTLSILLIGAIGYIPKLKPISVAFLVLVVLVLLLSKGNPNTATGGFFSQFFSQIGATQAAVNSNTPSPTSFINSSLLNPGTVSAPTVGMA
jgi:hypothetical protein